MGLISSRFNLQVLPPGRGRSQQEETLYSYSLNKNYFSNYFLMGSERFEVNDPDYLFGDNSDLNFLSCSKPYSLPYKKAQQNLLANLNTKQKASNKVSYRANRLSSPLDILTGRHRQSLQSRKQDAQTQTLTNPKGVLNGGPEPSRPLIFLLNIRKETLRLVKSTNIDSDQNSLTNNESVSISGQNCRLVERGNSQNVEQATAGSIDGKSQVNSSSKRYSLASSHATTSTIHISEKSEDVGTSRPHNISSRFTRNSPETTSALASSPSLSASTRSDYTSIKDASPSNTASDDENFEDALNETTNGLSPPKDDDEDNESEKTQQQVSLLHGVHKSTKDNHDVRITIKQEASAHRNTASKTTTSDTPATKTATCDMEQCMGDREANNVYIEVEGDDDDDDDDNDNDGNSPNISKGLARQNSSINNKLSTARKISLGNIHLSNRVYNIEFNFDCEVDCSIAIYYFCTREVNSSGVNYKPQHPTYKSKTYTFKKGLNQKFEQQEHTFQPYLFDEDLLIYRPLDLDGNYNTGAVFPIVIHCIALEGPIPRQSLSLVATVEKSQLDDSYSIKPLKQLIFVDGVQYILQDIYGIENKRLTTTTTNDQQSRNSLSRPRPYLSSRSGRNQMRASSSSLQSNFSSKSNMNIAASNLDVADNASMHSYDTNFGDVQFRGSNHQFKSLTGENSFECVICMSEERDTMLLPCRHLCLCSSCAQSLRYQASSCPICRCPFKAALNLRVLLPGHRRRSFQATSTVTTSSINTTGSSNWPEETSRQTAC